MPQADDYEDDYYDDDDDYYDEESQGPSVLVLVLVAVVLLMGLGAVAIGGLVYLEKTQEPVDPSVSAPAELDVLQPEEEGGSLGEDPDDAVVEEDPADSEPAEPVVSEPEPDFSAPTPAPVRENRDATNDRSAEPRWRDRSSERSRDRASEGSAMPSRGSRSRSTAVERSGDMSSGSSSRNSGSTRRTADRNEDFVPRGASSRSRASSDRSIVVSNDGGASSDPPSRSDSEDIRPGDIVDSSTPPEARSSRRKNYDKEAIASLGSRAIAGKLDRDEIEALKEIAPDSKNFTFAWSTVLKNAEQKRNYKEHCNAAQRIMSLPQNKYHPEWNLEMAKCQMRNGQYPSAVASVDRTLLDSYGMTASTKARRLLTAYEIRAVSKTQIFERNAKANSGLTDAAKLRSALEAWTNYKNYAQGTGNTTALRRAQKEISDLEDRS